MEWERRCKGMMGVVNDAKRVVMELLREAVTEGKLQFFFTSIMGLQGRRVEGPKKEDT